MGTQRYQPGDVPRPAPPPPSPLERAAKLGVAALRSRPKSPTLARPKGITREAAAQPVAANRAVAKAAAANLAVVKPAEAKPAVAKPAEAKPAEAKPAEPKAVGLPAVGDTIEERYRVLRPIGVGGMGHVFLVEHVRLQKRLALKVLSPDVLAHDGSDAQKARFLLEARAASRLRHPGIVEINDFGTTKNGLPFIVMEYLDGEDLADRLDRDGPMPWPMARDVVVQVLEALEEAHAHGVVHRDIKPENCFLSRTASGVETIKLVDFGIAKVLTEVSGAGPLTQRGELLGTPQYMSPEQALGHPVDSRSDVYAVGILLYELLTGAPPFQEGPPMEILTHQITRPPAPLLDQVHGADKPPVAMGEVAATALAKDPAARYASARAMIEALQQVDAPETRVPPLAMAPAADESVPSGIEAPAVAALPPRGRGRLWIVAAAVAIALVVVVTGIALSSA